MVGYQDGVVRYSESVLTMMNVHVQWSVCACTFAVGVMWPENIKNH